MPIILIICAAICTGIEIPENFSGSREVFSGYLPDKQKFVEAFSYRKDCKVIEGNATLVFLTLAQFDPKGKFFLKVWSYCNVYTAFHAFVRSMPIPQAPAKVNVLA